MHIQVPMRNLPRYAIVQVIVAVVLCRSYVVYHHLADCQYLTKERRVGPARETGYQSSQFENCDAKELTFLVGGLYSLFFFSFSI